MTANEADYLFSDLYGNDSVELVDPIRMLMIAVMIRAWRDCNPGAADGIKAGKKNQADAIAWLEGWYAYDDNPFSLENICEYLELDAEAFRTDGSPSSANCSSPVLFSGSPDLNN